MQHLHCSYQSMFQTSPLISPRKSWIRSSWLPVFCSPVRSAWPGVQLTLMIGLQKDERLFLGEIGAEWQPRLVGCDVHHQASRTHSCKRPNRLRGIVAISVDSLCRLRGKVRMAPEAIRLCKSPSPWGRWFLGRCYASGPVYDGAAHGASDAPYQQEPC